MIILALQLDYVYGLFPNKFPTHGTETEAP